MLVRKAPALIALRDPARRGVGGIPYAALPAKLRSALGAWGGAHDATRINPQHVKSARSDAFGVADAIIRLLPSGFHARR